MDNNKHGLIFYMLKAAKMRAMAEGKPVLIHTTEEGLPYLLKAAQVMGIDLRPDTVPSEDNLHYITSEEQRRRMDDKGSIKQKVFVDDEEFNGDSRVRDYFRELEFKKIVDSFKDDPFLNKPQPEHFRIR